MNNNDLSEASGVYKRHRRKSGSTYFILILTTLVVGITIGVIITMLIDSFLDGRKDIADSEAQEIVITDSDESEHELTEEDIDEIRLQQEAEAEQEVLLESESTVSEQDDDRAYEEEPLEEGDLDTAAEENQSSINEDSEAVIDEAEEKGLLELLKESLIQGEGTLPSLRKVFRDQIMVVAEGDFYFFNISDTLKKHGYSQENLVVSENGRMDYFFEDGSSAKTGVDVSKYQGAIEWDKVKNDGIDFAIIRSGVRGYGSGKLVMEEDFLANAAAASAQGLEIGTYFFSQAVNTDEAIEEADCVIEALGGYPIAYPVVYDLERVTGGRMSGLSKEQMTANCIAFCSRIKESGYEPMIYGNMETLMLLLDMEQLEDYEKWLAYYNTDIYFPYNFRIWQYTEKGRVAGISGDVDLNLCFY